MGKVFTYLWPEMYYMFLKSNFIAEDINIFEMKKVGMNESIYTSTKIG